MTPTQVFLVNIVEFLTCFEEHLGTAASIRYSSERLNVTFVSNYVAGFSRQVSSSFMKWNEMNKLLDDSCLRKRIVKVCWARPIVLIFNYFSNKCWRFVISYARFFICSSRQFSFKRKSRAKTWMPITWLSYIHTTLVSGMVFSEASSQNWIIYSVSYYVINTMQKITS